MPIKNKLLVGGRWVDASDGATFSVSDPGNGERLAEVASASLYDGKAAVEAAAQAGPGWAAKSPRERSEILRRAYELIVENRDRLARLVTLENGKALPDSMSEITYAAEFFRWFAEEAVRANGTWMPAPASGAQILTTHRPAGVSLLITPWNYPAAMGTRKIAPALAAGCTVIVKPASDTPLTMLEIAQLLVEAGVPAGVVNVLPSRRSGELAASIMADERVRVVSFTGSTEVGRTLLGQAARTVVTPAMELGGNAPLIVMGDADIDRAIEGTMIAKMRNIGSACTAANRIFVHNSVCDSFTAALVKRMGSLKMGYGLEPGIDVGTLVNHATREKVHELVSDAIARGARLLLGGEIRPGPGFYYPPTVLADVPADALCVANEIFGPVAAIQRFQTEDEVVELANTTEYGLSAYIFTEDFRKGMAMASRLDFGMIGLNRGLVSEPAAPFGGMKQSGIGREGGHDGLLEFLETQYISTEW
jgi:succinate-semialdehyde dehydrogenase / glutarate-semialdehyde dehydrogenase